MVDQLRQNHPNPFNETPEGDFQKQVDTLDQEIPFLTRDQVILGLIRLAARIDGHTHIQITQPALGYHVYPLHLYFFSDGLYVTDALEPYRSSIGARVVSIGHQTAAQLYPLLAPVANHDNDQTIQSILPLFYLVPEVLRAAGVIDDPARPQFVLESPNGERVTLNPAPISFDEYRSHWASSSLVGLPPQAAPLYLSRRNENFWFTFLPDSKTLYLQYNQVQASTPSGQSISSFCQQVATFVAQNDVRRVVVDIRHNFGGEDQTYPPLLQLLTQNPAINQPGKLFVIIGRQTFSAAILFADELERDSHTVFAGEPTGGSPNFYDQTLPYYLPNSLIQVQISTLYFPGSAPDDHRPWIEPQLPVSLSSKDYFNQKDPVLEAILRGGALTSTPAAPTPAAALSAGQAVTFTTDDGVVLGGTVYGSGTRAVIFSNIGSGLQPDWQELPRLVAQHGDVALTYDWRGFGASGGQQDYSLSQKDLAAAIRLIRARGAKQIVLVGASLGGMASLMNAAIPELAGLVVLSSPQQAPHFIVTPEEVAAITAPKLFVASRQDTTVAYSATTALYDLASRPKTLLTYAGAAHGTDILKTADHDDLVQRILDFVVQSMPNK